jgi:type I restriction enzyme M protein
MSLGIAKASYSFDYMLSNPPFGVTWGGKDGYEDAADSRDCETAA